ncbi:MAG: nuclear transport factor 2 family protein [Terracidiphilus sp.]
MHDFVKSFDRGGLLGLPSVTVMPKATIKASKLISNRTACALALLAALGALAPAAFATPPHAPPHGQMPKAQKHESRHEIDQLEEVWRDAVLKANAAAMDSLLADDYMAITPNGNLQSKEQALASLRSGTPHITAIEISDHKVRFYGTTALVTSRADVSGTNAGADFSGSYRYTRVYVRDAQGKWKIVSFEASRIREPGEKK